MKKNNKENTTVEKSSVTRTPSTANLKYFILAGCLLIVLFLIGFFVTRNNSTANVSIPTKNIEDVECLKKGKVCTTDELREGIKVKYKVNKTDTEEFYVLSNDENKMNLLLAHNIGESTYWSEEVTNVKGPTTALTYANKLVKKWTNVPYITDYNYVDFGYKYYLDVCVDKTVKDEKFDCNAYAGYKDFTVKDGKLTILYNMPEPDIEGWETMEDLVYTNKFEMVNLRIRLATIEEINELVIDKKGLPKWLIDGVKKNGEYWTMSSNPFSADYYDVFAYTVKNVKGKTDIGVKVVYNWEFSKDKTLEEDYEVYLRPVITINKK